MGGLYTVLSCFREIALENYLTLKINGIYTKRYTIAIFEIQTDFTTKAFFYKLLTDRKKSGKCIEYICINWHMNESGDNITDTDGDNITDTDGDNITDTDGDNITDTDGDNITDTDGDNITQGFILAINKTLAEEKLKKAAGSVEKAINELKEISKKSPVSAINKLVKKLKEVVAGIKKLIDALKEKSKKGINSVLKHSHLNTERADSSMQKSIVYIAVIVVAALLFIAAGVFVFKMRKVKSKKQDLFTNMNEHANDSMNANGSTNANSIMSSI